MSTQTLERHSYSAKHIGRALAYARNGQSGEKVAQAAGISRRTLIKIEQGDPSVAMGSYIRVAKVLGCSWLFGVTSADDANSRVPRHYLTGASALSLPGRNTPATALWYSSSLQRPESWQIAGVDIVGAGELLGVTGLWDATRTLEDLGIEVGRIWAASHERAVFDLMYHYCEHKSKPIPNIQASDIDDIVDLNQVVSWIQQCTNFLSPEGVERMHHWLQEADR